MIRLFRNISSPRHRLLIGFLLVAALPSLVISIGSIITGYNSGKQQALERLASQAELKAIEISSLLGARRGELFVILNEQYMADWLDVALKLASRDQYYDLSSRAIRLRFIAYINQARHFSELMLLDLQGKIIVSSQQANEGIHWLFIAASLPADSSKAYSYLSVSQSNFIANIIPVVGEDTLITGYLAGITSLDDLQGILQGDPATDTAGTAYLVTLDRTSLPGGQAATSSGIEAAFDNHTTLVGVMEDDRGERVFGVYRWLPELSAVLVVEQEFTAALGGIAVTLGVNVFLALLSLVFASAATVFILRSVRLESRVHERTQALADANRDLERRALQLETSARLGREITSILQIEALLNRITQLIKASFGYYHINIFLVAESGDRLQLAASSGPVEPQFLDLPLNEKSLNGTAALTRLPVLANDAELDPRYLPDANLPQTRAEMALPLQIGESVIGTLDVQSTERNTFADEDALVLQSLADQIAIAIENARLYDRSRELATLEERNRLARDMHDSVTQTLYSLSLLAKGWTRLIQDGEEPHVEQRLAKVSEITSQALKEMRLLIHQLRPPALATDGLIGALRQRLDAVETRAGVEARLLIDDVIELPADIEECFYYIAQEGLNNALKHAAASKVTVGVSLVAGEAALIVYDDGRGFDPQAALTSGGLGLTSMRERIRQLNGELELTTAPGKGVRLAARVSVSSGRKHEPNSSSDRR